MPIHPQFLVRDMKGRPLPSPELVEKLRKYDPRIGLFYTKSAWAVTESWRENDPRREWIQNGSMQPEYAFDICGYLPVTCALDEAPAYIARELTSWSPEMFKGLREAVNKWNTVDLEAATEDAVLGAVSNDLDKSNIVAPGIYETVMPGVFAMASEEASKPFDFSQMGSSSVQPTTTLAPALTGVEKARAALAAKRAAATAPIQAAG